MRNFSIGIIFVFTLAVLPIGVSPVRAASKLWDSNLWEGAPVEEAQTTPSAGRGFYLGIQGGINAYQNYEGTERSTIGGTRYAVELREKVGGYGGIKWGYAFSAGERVSSAIEADIFYNGADFAVDARADGKKFLSATGRLDTGAVMVNYILRYGEGSHFRPFVGAGRFQPYIGAGIGGWFGQISDTRVTLDGAGSLRISSDDTEGGFAWQLLAGADYFFSHEMSFFTEYKFLNYTGVVDDSVQQHLVGVGLRFHF